MNQFNTSDFNKLARKLVAPLLFSGEITVKQALKGLKLEFNHKNQALMSIWKSREAKCKGKLRGQRLDNARKNWESVQPTENIKPSENSIEVEVCPMPVTPYADTTIASNDLNQSGISLISQHISEARNSTIGGITSQLKLISSLINKLEELVDDSLTIKEIDLATKALKSLIELQRDASLLPKTFKDLKPMNGSNTPNSLHFHNHGLKGYEPK